MTESPGLRRARADIADGRLWKARDRLHGLIVTNAGDQVVLGLLGEVLFQMGDLPAAGRYWFLTERAGADVDVAVEAMREQAGSNPGVLLNALPVKAPVEAYPPVVQARVRELDAAVPRGSTRPAGLRVPTRPMGAGAVVTLVVVVFIFIALTLIGLVTVVAWLIASI